MQRSKSYSTDCHQQLTPRTPSTPSSSWFSTTSVHVMALDGIVNVNSLFTVAVFIGLSLTSDQSSTLKSKSSCSTDVEVAKTLVVFEVSSFSFFLFSSLIAQGLKLAINLLNSREVEEALKAKINVNILKFGMMGSAIGSVMGCLFLMLAMVNVVEIKLGLLSCGGKTAYSVATLIILVTIGLSGYISIAVYAFMH
ncbi:unnamed protein product [Ilex paraguariensis]|uniref:Maternal effect embryo arrest protein n=1 Tax=Ilex paraguariensis TaxID=185542 RepID=A0ABC8R8X1_9AQUA